MLLTFGLRLNWLSKNITGPTGAPGRGGRGDACNILPRTNSQGGTSTRTVFAVDHVHRFVRTYMKIEGNIRGFYVEEKFHVANWGTNCPPIVKICVPKTGDASNILLASYRARLSSSEMRNVFSRIGGQTVTQCRNRIITKNTDVLIHINTIMYCYISFLSITYYWRPPLSDY